MQNAVDKGDIQITWHSGDGWSTWRMSRFQFESLLWNEQPAHYHLRRALTAMTEQEQLFADYFKKAYDAAIDIEKMSYEELDSWITQLEKVVFEAKATLQGADAAKRERRAKLSESEREKTRSKDSQFITSDAINAVRKRADRMSKRDKLLENYVNMGMSREEAEKLISGMVSINEDTQASKNNLVTFESGKKKENVIDKIVNSIVNAPKSNEPEIVEDIDALFGK